jgi:predicted nucleotidyltransferase
VLALLLLHPERTLHVREIARLTGTTAGTLNKELALLHATGLLERERVGNQVRYAANRSHPVYADLSGVLRKTVGLADVLLVALGPIADRITSAFVYGSMARGTDVSGSDIDLLVIGNVDFGTVVDVLHEAQQQLGREINPKVYTPAEWKAKTRSGDAFVRELAMQPRRVLIGDEHGPARTSRR